MMGNEVLEHYECDGQMSLDDLGPALKSKRLQAYLKRYDRDALVDIIVVDNTGRLNYPVMTQYTATDMGNPCIVVIVGSPEDLDRGNLEHTDLSDQMALDFSPNTDLINKLGVHVLVVACERAGIKGGHAEVLNGKYNSSRS